MRYFAAIITIVALVFGISYAGGKKTATWTIPTTYTDGTPLLPADIKEFRLHQGTAPRTYTTVITIPASTNQYMITASTGTFYFALTTVTKEGSESDYSNELMNYFPPGKPSSCIFSWQ